MRLLICGSRDWINKSIIKHEVELLHTNSRIEVIIHGGCRGADLLGAKVAQELNIPIEEYIVDWNKYGKSAGPRRNQKMIDDGKPDFVLAFHDDIDSSKGTLDMILRSQKHKINYKIVREIITGI